MLQACFEESWPGQEHMKPEPGAPPQVELARERAEAMSTIKHIHLKKHFTASTHILKKTQSTLKCQNSTKMAKSFLLPPSKQ